MDEPTAPRTGLAIVRVWWEPGSSAMKIRLTSIDDILDGPGTAEEWTGTSSEAVLSRLRSWLRAWEKGGV